MDNKTLYQLELEIKKIEYQINNITKENKKIKRLKNLKISLRTCQLVFPYLIISGLLFESFKLLGMTPFAVDKQKENLKIKKEIDSFGNIKYEEQYKEFKDKEPIIIYNSKWSKDSAGFYKREVKKYRLNNKITYEIIEDIVNNVDLESINEIFKNPYIEVVEKKSNLTYEELNEPEHLKAIIYSEDENNYIIIDESIVKNVGETIGFHSVLFIVNVLTAYIRFSYFPFDYGSSISAISKNYLPLNTNILEKKLKIKKENYERLMRK